MFTRLLFIAAILISPAYAAARPAEGFRKLTGPQIRRAFTGKQFSDGVHFSYRYVADGTIQGMKMGKKVVDKWAVATNKLCVTDHFGETCYDVWIKNSAVKLTIDGSDFSVEGTLK
ncbi:hypothetical protein [Methylosinus sp. Ce-a6]|uniref:hypothetical protein n=1 Tax=Methylosinus sp. Ce-a6 TaxID=2172005 RepID=UPI001356BB4A|nr:hypothetical protein [Methylosinus sp. Ce-a6]